MAEKKEGEKNTLSWVKSLFSFFSDLINTLVEHSDAEIKKIKENPAKY